MPFRDRVDAGRQLGQALQPLRGPTTVVLGLPRGGVPVAAEVARALDAPLDVIVVRKLGLPRHPELAMGAIGEGGVRVLNDGVLRSARVTADELEAVAEREQAELLRRTSRLRGGRPHASLVGRTAVLVDDGIATGSTARAACRVARALGAARVVLAVPVGAPSSLDELARVADDVVCLERPAAFMAVGEWYGDFRPTTDDEVERLLAEAAASRRVPVREPQLAVTADVEIPVGSLRLPGQLVAPAGARGVVVFAHGSGSSRHSPRNRAVAASLEHAGLGTLLFDLLTAQEEQDRANVFDVRLLGERLGAVIRWLRTHPVLGGLPIGCFGASTGAAAALWAAADPASGVAAVVSRGGRPDLAWERLPAVTAPTLLIVGGHDHQVLELNRRAAAQLRCEHDVVVVPGATHLFEERGTLASVADLAGEWFLRHLPAVPGVGAGASRQTPELPPTPAGTRRRVGPPP